jgi:hypothetical protein
MSSDSGGVPWSGRELTGTGFEGDTGGADPDLLAALANPQDEIALMKALTRARLLVPIVALPPDPHGSAHRRPTRDSHTHDSHTHDSHTHDSHTHDSHTDEGSTDMAVVTLTAPDGQRVFPVFSSVAALSAWDATARPSPVTSARAAQGAVSERCDVMLLDCGSDHEQVLRPSMVWALAQQREWLPAHTDPFVTGTFERATADEDDVLECVLETDPAEPSILRVALGLRGGLDAKQVQALATRIGERIATDGEARARIDGIAFTIRHA